MIFINKFIKSTLILIIGGFITKIMGLITKILITRYIGLEGITLYSLIMPTFSLFIGLCQAGLPLAITKLVSEERYNSKNIILISLILSIFVNIFLMITIFISARFISLNMLKNENTYYPILSIMFTLPFISISSIIRAYFFGKQKMIPHVISNIMEDIVRFIILLIFIPLTLKKGIIYTICFLITSNIISEITSIFTLYLFLPHKINLNKNDFNFKYLNKITNISIPSLFTRLIGNIGYFLEPIILTNSLLLNGYSSNYILREYGIINGYVISLLTIPSFFTNAISSSILPIISNDYSNNKSQKNKILFVIIISLFIGLCSFCIFFFFSKYLLGFIYKTNLGLEYIKILAPFFILFYLEAPLKGILNGLNLNKESMYGSIIGIVIKLFLIFILSFIHIGIYNLIISIIVNIIFVVFHHIICIKKRTS